MPAIDKESLESARLEECYLAQNLSALERKLTPEDGFSAAFNEGDTSLFAILGETFRFFNIEITQPSPKTDVEDVPLPTPPQAKRPTFVGLSGVTSQFLTSSPFPSESLNTVQPKGTDVNEYSDETRYFEATSKSLTTTSVNDIQPNLIRKKNEYFSPTTAGRTQPKLEAHNLLAFTIDGFENSIDEGFWGMTLANRSFYRKDFDTLVANREDMALYQDYIHQMSEAVHNNASKCENIEGKGCLLSKLASPTMNPLYTETITFEGNTILMGFTTYRVVPFFGISNSGQSMIMPNDEFVTEHGGIGFGSASVVAQNQIFSFGGFSYDPDLEWRPFEKLPHGHRYPPRRSWYPVWPRESIIHGCANAVETCTYESEFTVNTNPRRYDLPKAPITTFNPLAAKRQATDKYYALVRIPPFLKLENLLNVSNTALPKTI